MHLLPTGTAADEAVRNATIAVLPVGAFEQHGDHLPLATDTMIAALVASRLASEHSLLCLPPITISCSHEHQGFPGTVSISATTLIAVIADIRSSLALAGIEKLILVSGHGGNYVLANVTQESNVEGPKVVLFPGKEDWATARIHAELGSNSHDDMHGGELETSLMMYAFPDLVGDNYRHADHEARERRHLFVTGVRHYSENGIIGRPSLASAEKGRIILKSLLESFPDYLKMLDV